MWCIGSFPHPPPRFDLRALLAAALGGVIGATLRWAVSLPYHVDRGEFPWDDLTVNLLGSLAIGVAAARLARSTISWAFIVTGILGGFTTMSGFALAFNDLIRDDRATAALVYVIVTMTGGVAAILLGEKLSRRSATR